MLTRLQIVLLAFIASGSSSAIAAPCSSSKDLTAAIECVKSNEPSYQAASQGEKESAELKSSAYRLINPELELEFTDGSNLGNVEREKSASLLFTFELGGKRSARAKIFESEGLGLKADAFEQQIQVLTSFGGAILKLNQLQAEKSVLQESVGAFKRVIGLYRSRGALPPEQKVSLHTFELVLLGYERKLIEIDSSILQYTKRVETLFGPGNKLGDLDIKQWTYDEKKYRQGFEQWLENTPEMMRQRAAELQSEGQSDMALADVWPNLQIGPSISQVTEGPTNFMTYGVKASFPIPLLSWNVAGRRSRETTASRVQTRATWNRQDIRAKYDNMLSEMSRIQTLLASIPSATDLQKKHSSTESLYDRGLITGALMIETHRALIEYYEAKHELQAEYLQGLLTLQHLERSVR